MASPTHGSPLSQDLRTAIFAMLVLGGQFCFPIMFLCFFISRNTFSKSSLFLHFCFAWVFHSVAFCILLYTGNVTGPEPAFLPCIIQAVLVYMAPVLTSSFLCALVYHLCFTINSVMNSKMEASKQRMLFLITGPYFISLVPAFFVCIVAMNRPELVTRGREYYCSVEFGPLRVASASLAGTFLAISVALQCRIGFVLYKMRLVLKQVKVQGFGLLQLFTRLSLFMVITAIGLSMVLVAIADAVNMTRIVFQATLPLLAFLTFGTQLGFYSLRRQERPAGGEQPPSKWRPKTPDVIT